MMLAMGKFSQTLLDDSSRLRSLLAREFRLESRRPALYRRSPDRERRKETRS